MKRKLTLLLLLFGLIGFSQDLCKKIIIEVCVPGNTLLHIKHGTMFWEVVNDMPPGAFELCIGETKVNSAVWGDWKTKYNLNFNTDNCKLTAEVIRKHDISQLIQAPTAKNGWESIWSFNDPSGSAHYYSTSFEFCKPAKDKPAPQPLKKEEKQPEKAEAKPEFKKDSVLVKKETKAVELPFYKIYFEKQKSAITKSSQTELNSIYNNLKTNSTIVEIFGYDKKEEQNATDLKLYNERALELCGYLMGKGLDQKRIQYIGYGDKALEDTKSKRIELKILQEN